MDGWHDGPMPPAARLRHRVRQELDLRAGRLPRVAQPFSRPTFSQTGEDSVVAFLFGELRMPKPSYLDIGAYHPFELSNTAAFYAAGSRGINVEPDPASYRLFTEHRLGDVNLNVGCSDVAGHLTFYTMSVPTLSTFSRASAEEAIRASNGRLLITATSKVPVRTVADILAREGGGRCPDFLSLDVEGLDLAILRSLPDWPSTPTVICVETITYSETGRGQKIDEIAQVLDEHGYMQFADTYINSIFVIRDRWADH